MGPDALILIFWMLSFKSASSLSSFTFIKRLYSSSSLSAIRVVSSAYLRLLIFFSAILILACASSSLAFHMMYSAYKFNKQGDNFQPWHIPFPIWNLCCSMSSSNCCFLTCTQISQEASQVVWYSHLFKNFSQFVVIHTVKAFGIVNKAEIDLSLELSCFFCDPMDDPMDLLFDHFQFTLIRRPNIPGSYATLFFTASDFASITRHIRNWVLFSLWLSLFILSWAISLLFSTSIFGTYRPGEFIFQCPIFLPFHTIHGVLKARILQWFAIPFSTVNSVLRFI